tara:strand:- start:6547 stop:7617 length:1071 start_codon:yes stop_codon:yes gene_type:complete
MKRNLLVINGLQGGGAEKVCTKLADLLYKKGIPVEILVIKNADGPLRENLDKNITVHNLGVKRARNSLSSLISFFKRNRYDNIICFNFQLGILVKFVIVLLRGNSKVSLRVINTISMTNSSGFISKLYYEYCYRWFEFIIFQCYEMKKDFESNYPISSNKCKVIYNPCASNLNKLLPKKSSCDRISIEKVVFAGRLESQKNIMFMLESLRFAVDINPNIVLFIYGDGSLKSSLSNYSFLMGLDDNVIFKPFTNDLDEVFESAKLSLLTSKFEGFPNFLLDSISYGIPCLSINCKSGPSEILNEVNGCLINKYDASEFGNKIVRMLETNWNHESIMRDAFDRFSEDKFLKSYIEILK